MAHTIRLDWIRRVLNSSNSTRQCRPMHDIGKPRICSQGPLKRLMRLIRNNSGKASGGNESSRTGRKPQNTPPVNTERQSPFRVNASPNANLVRIHPLARGQEKKRLPFEKSATMRTHSAQRRGEQLARSLRSQQDASGSRSSTIPPLKILEMVQRERNMMSSQQQIDAMRTRNMERMVRESQARRELLEKRLEKEVETESQTKTKTKIKLETQAVVELLKKAISFTHGEVRDVKVSRMQTKLEWNGRSTDMNPLGDNLLQSAHAYHMRIRCAMILSPRKPEPQSKKCRNIAANLIKEEQRRLDTLKAEKVHLKDINNLPMVSVENPDVFSHISKKQSRNKLNEGPSKLLTN
ncbi:uncharacterized protein [Drosophila takahashii]|uniref:uncharacterized protein isoform X1 n=2 Tax=Drosophila takahashii TaxID=29030 RepID=UPI001CF8261C|nr:uncharacterized protein LOC108066910 [Drosophila takahashii]